MDNKHKPVIECIREFKLRQQYPSMIKKSKNVGKPVLINTSLESLRPVTARLKSKVNAQAKNGFHKFRLKLPSGKDLGECNVRILPNNKLKSNTVTIVNQNICKTANKSVILLSAVLENQTKNAKNSTVQKHVIVLPNTKYSHEIASNTKHDTTRNNIKYQSQHISSKYGTTNDQCYERIKNKGIENMDTDIIIDKGCNKNKKFQYSNIQRILENKQLRSENSFLKLSDCLSFSRPAEVINDILLFPLTEAPNYSISTSGAITKTVQNNSNIVNSCSQNDQQLGAEKKLHFSSIREKNVNLSLEQKLNKIGLKSDNYSFTQQTMNTICDKSIPTQNIDEFSKENHVDKNTSLKKTCSDCSVLKEVMSTIRNEKLEVKALEASADYASETEQIPLNIPKGTRTMCDTKMQTETHSLLKSENILNIKEDTPRELYFTSIQEDLNVNSLPYMPFFKNSIFSPFNPLEKSDRFLDKSIDGNVINDICHKHSTANKVKEVLSQPNVSCNKIFEQLQRDFETVRKWDENGMLNIHKAVISNRIYDIQRHLMVLKACNVNVDIPTQSGMTSLELAIKYNVSTEIVKLLLEAGANPASFQPIHESALIAASKISSSLLPLLINHVPSSRLLDYVDFTGFAALHYCAQYGNLQGVNSLINMGANVNLQESRSGRTPLFLSIENNHPVVAENLIKNGAQPDIPNFSGQTVMSLVEKITHLSLVTLLHTMR